MSQEPATVVMVEYTDASADVRAVFDDIMATKGIDFVPNAWKVFASHPPTLKRLWYGLKEVMAPGTLDPKFKEMIAVAVSVTNGCDYCTRSHTAAARKLGMTDAEYGELLFDQALLTEGTPLPNPAAFAKRVSKLMASV